MSSFVLKCFPPKSLPILEAPCHREFSRGVVPAELFHFSLAAVHRLSCSWLTLSIPEVSELWLCLWSSEMNRQTRTSHLWFHFDVSIYFLFGQRAKRVKRALCLFAWQRFVRSFLWCFGDFVCFCQFDRRDGCLNVQVKPCLHKKHLWMSAVSQYWMEGEFCGTVTRDKTYALSGKGNLILHKWSREGKWAGKCPVLQ